MTTLATQRTGFKNECDVTANSFRQEAGLPFASVLDAESIQRVFGEEKASGHRGGAAGTSAQLSRERPEAVSRVKCPRD